MKKVSLIAVLLLLTGIVANSQIDSIPYNVDFPYYYMMHPIDSLRVSSHDGVVCQPAWRRMGGSINDMWHSVEMSVGDRLAVGFYPDSTIHVIGFAFVTAENGVRQGSAYDAMVNFMQMYGFDHYTCRVYMPTGNTLQLLDSAVVTLSDFNPGAYRVYQYAVGYYGDIVPWRPYTGDGIIPVQHMIIEAFFNNEIDVTDSVYFSVDNYWHGCPYNAWYEYHTPNTNHYMYPMIRGINK